MPCSIHVCLAQCSSVAAQSDGAIVQGLAPPRATSETNPDTPKPASGGPSKRITTPHACAECKRRKIRCDGRQPCGQCLGCRSPKPCYYDKHRQRVIPSRKYVAEQARSLKSAHGVASLESSNVTLMLSPLTWQAEMLMGPVRPRLAVLFKSSTCKYNNG